MRIDKLLEPYLSIATERARQERLKAKGKFDWTPADRVNPKTGAYISPRDRLATISEEIGEVAHLVCDDMTGEVPMIYTELRKELVQVAALCVAWVEHLDRDKLDPSVKERGGTHIFKTSEKSKEGDIQNIAPPLASDPRDDEATSQKSEEKQMTIDRIRDRLAKARVYILECFRQKSDTDSRNVEARFFNVLHSLMWAADIFLSPLESKEGDIQNIAPPLVSDPRDNYLKDEATSQKSEKRPWPTFSFEQLRATNLERCRKWHTGTGVFGWSTAGVSGWSTDRWAIATIGELGEAMNIIKKLNRYRDGLIGNLSGDEESLRAELADELADTVIYLDLLAAREGIDLSKAIIDKFNRKSKELNLPHRLTYEVGATEE